MSPGRASIEAALYPEEHRYLHYVMGKDDRMFSENYEEHLRNIKNYRQQTAKLIPFNNERASK